MATEGQRYSGQRTFPGHSRPAREAVGRSEGFGMTTITVALLGLAAAHKPGHVRNGSEVGRRPEPEHRCSAGTHERRAIPSRQAAGRAPWRPPRRKHPSPLLRPAADDLEVRQPCAPALQEVRLTKLGFEGVTFRWGSAAARGIPGALHRATSIGPSRSRTTPTPRRLSSSSIRRFGGVADRGQAGGLEALSQL